MMPIAKLGSLETRGTWEAGRLWRANATRMGSPIFQKSNPERPLSLTFGRQATRSDGITRNLRFEPYDVALHPWPYVDPTSHAE